MVGVPPAGAGDPDSAERVASPAMIEFSNVPQMTKIHPRDVALYGGSRGTRPDPVVLVEVGIPGREENLEDGVDVAVLSVVAGNGRKVEEVNSRIHLQES